MAKAVFAARVLAFSALCSSASTAFADALELQYRQCVTIEQRILDLNAGMRYDATDAHLDEVKAAAARLPAMQQTAREIEVRAGCRNLTTRCQDALRPARDLEFEARSLANTRLNFVDIDTTGTLTSSQQIERIVRQFERMVPVVTAGNNRRKLKQGEIVQQQALLLALKCEAVGKLYYSDAEFKRRRAAAAATASSVPVVPPPVTAPPVPPSDPFAEGQALVAAGAALVDPAAMSPDDLVGTWIATGYYCDGDQPEELIRITKTGAQALVATKIRGDACVRSGEVTWRGSLTGKVIRGEVLSRERDAAANSGRWLPASLEVVSRDEIKGVGVRFVRSRAAP